jgi:hypothetical protein
LDLIQVTLRTSALCADFLSHVLFGLGCWKKIGSALYDVNAQTIEVLARSLWFARISTGFYKTNKPQFVFTLFLLRMEGNLKHERAAIVETNNVRSE